MHRRFYLAAALLGSIGLLGFVLPTPLFGVLDTTPLLNVVHLTAAILTVIAAGRGLGTMRAWGQVLGYVFAALTATGIAIDAESVANLLPLSNNNVYFHLAVTLFYLYHALLAPPTI